MGMADTGFARERYDPDRFPPYPRKHTGDKALRGFRLAARSRSHPIPLLGLDDRRVRAAPSAHPEWNAEDQAARMPARSCSGSASDRLCRQRKPAIAASCRVSLRDRASISA